MQFTGFASIGIGIDNKFQSVQSSPKSPLIGIFPNRGDFLTAAASAVRALVGVQDRTVDLRPCRLSTRKRKLLSVQYLTNQKANHQLLGVRST